VVDLYASFFSAVHLRMQQWKTD